MILRGSHYLILLFWAASMSWLFVAKMMPTMIGGDPPDYQSRLDHPEMEPECWRIKYNEKTIGFAASQVIQQGDGAANLRNVVHFEQLPLESMARQLFGGLAFLMQPFFAEASAMNVEMLVATQIEFSPEKHPRRFYSTIDVNNQEGLLTIDGTTDGEGHFDFVARLNQNATGESRELLRHQLRLPPEVLLSDSVSPRAELRDLQLGQSWTMPVYRAFPPNQPVQIVQATVERHEIIFWEGSDIETLLVVYREDAGAGVQSTRAPIGKEWVRKDGTILRQELNFSGMKIQFERFIDVWGDSRTRWLDADEHPRLWSHQSDD